VGIDQVFVEVHNRTQNPLSAAQVNVLLLATDASAGLPQLPANYATHINALHTTTPPWLMNTPWQFVDPSSPYHQLPRDLDVRTPQVVEFDFDFSSVPLPAGHDHVCLAAFVTHPMDPVTANVPSLDNATMIDKHIVHRNVHLMMPGSTMLHIGFQMFMVDFWNPVDEAAHADLVFDRRNFPGALAVVLPEGVKPELQGFEAVPHARAEQLLRSGLDAWRARAAEQLEAIGADEADDRDERHDDFERRRRRKLRKIARLDHSHVFLAPEREPASAFRRVQLKAHAPLSALVAVALPHGAEPGQRYRLDVLQQRGKTIVGGSTYIIAAPLRPKGRRGK
jgi:hypothetical protein